MSTQQQEEPRERMFDPSKFPLEEPARELVAAFIALVVSKERRERARRGADKQRFEAALSALVLDLAHMRLEHPDGWLYASMTKGDYTPRTRAAPFLTETFPALLHMLRKARLLQLRLGVRGNGFGEGRLTTIRPGKALRDLIDAADLLLGDIGRDFSLQGDPLRLRTIKKKKKAEELPVPETEQARALRAEMLAVNRWLNEARVTCDAFEGERYPDTGNRYMRRTFIGTLDYGGRLNGGFWQAMGKTTRLSSLSINDAPCAELDYGQIGLRIAYSKVGAQPPPGDLYCVPGLEGHRDAVKLLINALLSKDGPMTRFPPETADLFPRLSFAEALRFVVSHHSALMPLFGTRFYLLEQRIESDILLACVHRMRERGLHGLPIHDCLLVSVENATPVKAIMEACAFDALSLTVPVEIKVSDEFQYMLCPASTPSTDSFQLVGSIAAVGTDAAASNTTIGTLSVPHKKGA